MPKALHVVRAAGFVRPNFRGDLVPASAGVVIALVYTSALLLWQAVLPGTLPVQLALSATAMALVGFVDDVWGDSATRGFVSHVRLLLRGGLSTGGVKAVFGAVVAAAAARGAGGGLLTTLLGGLVIALAANTVNLLDVRPGRALKGALFLHGALWAASWTSPVWPYVLPLWGCLAAYGPYDLRARAMLGDAGANCIGAVAGVAAVHALGPTALSLAALLLVGLHVVAERFSITAVIERVPALKRLDEWGRE